jgi:hypothetical protein
MTETLSLIDRIKTDGGFTFDPFAEQLITAGTTTGYMIAIPGTEMHLGPAAMTREQFAARFAVLLSNVSPGVYVGGWLSPDRGFMIELSELHHVDRETAIALGKARNQEGIFDLATGEFIPTGGTGDSD